MKNRSLFKRVFQVAYNLLLIVLGVIAIASPEVFTTYVGLISGIFVLAIAVCLIILGFITFSVAFSGHFLLIGGFLALGVGIFFIVYPGVGMSLVTIFLAFMFLFNGISKITVSMQQKRFHLNAYLYNLIFGIFYIILSIFMFFFTREFNDIVSLIFGIFLLVAGISGAIQAFMPDKSKAKEERIISKAKEDSEHIDIDFTKWLSNIRNFLIDLNR